ncbi:MAG TPA: CerR family C-terminal domain-containing protein [Geobacteraceae bacterium]|nr:CerR family C-terminal domain-containing protein [Geobacteraceae bacterium]
MDTELSETRTRILEAAASIFAEYGFAATTIRMICGLARVNLAAVNYHFGNKEGLYSETIRYLRRQAYDRYPTTYDLSPGASPEEKLLAFIRSFLLRTAFDERNLRFGTLVMREMVEPTSALDMMVDEGIRSLFGQLVDIVRSLMGETADEETVLACSRSVMSQCLFYLFSRSVITRMSSEHQFNQTDIDTISDQILSFSLHALDGLRAELNRKRTGAEKGRHER